MIENITNKKGRYGIITSTHGFFLSYLIRSKISLRNSIWIQNKIHLNKFDNLNLIISTGYEETEIYYIAKDLGFLFVKDYYPYGEQLSLEFKTL